VLAAENIGALGHKVHTAEHDIATLGLRSLEGEFEGVTAEIGELDDFVALVVMAQYHDVLAQAGLGGGDAVIQALSGTRRYESSRSLHRPRFPRADSGRLVYAVGGCCYPIWILGCPWSVFVCLRG